MSKPSRAANVVDAKLNTPRTFFVTSNTWERRQLFRSARMAKLFLEVIYHYRAESHFLLHDFCLMPDHFHLLITVRPGITIEKVVQLIKGGFSFRAAREMGFRGEIWQRGFSEHQIREPQSFQARRDYIAQNAVHRRLASRPEDYEYCSFYAGFEADLCPLYSGAKAQVKNNGFSLGTTKVVP
jgi:putative transposase